MTARTLSRRQRNRTLLARQLLLERSAVTIPAALVQLSSIQNQNAPNAYIRLWSCLAGFRRAELTAAYESGEVVQGTLMRGTIHAVSAADYHPLAAAIREPMQAWAKRVHRGAADSRRAEFIEAVRHALRGRPPVKRDAFLALLADAGPVIRQTIHLDAEILRVPPSGTWERRRADLFGLADDAIGRHEEIDPQTARRHLVSRYLVGFGPASAESIATFTGIPAAMLAPTLDSMELAEYRAETGVKLLDVPGSLIADPDTAAPVRFLPSWDAILLVHARGTGVVAEEHRQRIFHVHVGQSPPTFMVDGTVAGTWHWDQRANQVAIDPFAPLPSKTTAEVEEEAAGLADFHR